MIEYACRRTVQRQAQAGVGLIEVLIAVLVVSIGFLGVAALQATALSTNNSAMARSMATISSYSILDAMRADKNHALAGAYDGTVVANACPDAGGTLASDQLHLWCEQLGHNLGAAETTTGKIACTTVIAGTAGYCTVTIAFDDSRSGLGGGVDSDGITTIVTKAEL